MRKLIVSALLWIWSAEFFHFVAVGLVSASIHYGLFLLFYRTFSLHYQIATTIGFAVALVVNFLLHRYWTFSNATLSSTSVALPLFSLKKVIFYLLNAPLLFVLVERVDIAPEWAQLLLIPILGVPSYFLVKLIFWFSRPKPPPTN